MYSYNPNPYGQQYPSMMSGGFPVQSQSSFPFSTQWPASFYNQQWPFYNQQSFPSGQYAPPYYNGQNGSFGNIPTAFGHVMNGIKILKQLSGMTSLFY
ncbi:hypothetical protein JOD45_002901 [Scopulibacillus daqui]|uniref:YppG-like protein n=1 Tax=Scopulibacillus daqui TaxID=1469162 RepID=A0ABS2Q2Z1_9BACL|nr:hypothetical protein [Scopulibacillus daqui]